MSFAAQPHLIPNRQLEQLREAKGILRAEFEAIARLMDDLGPEFCDAVDRILDCRGTLILTGIGKAGLIGQKIAATLSSTGTRAQFLHPVEAVHGDLGCLHPEDMVLALSNSGETEEVCRLLPILRDLEIPVIAMTATERSTLGRAADLVLRIGQHTEAGSVRLAPSTSTTVMLALGDALALTISHCRGFTARDFARFHPGGSLGRKLSLVTDIMRTGQGIRVASEDETVRQIFARLNSTGRRTGAVMLVDNQQCLTGLFTDSDLARLLEQHRESQLDRPVREVMTLDPLRILSDARVSEAIELLSEKKISELPVVDPDHKPVGMVDITDIIGLMPGEVTTE